VGTEWRTVSAGMAGFAPTQLVHKLASKIAKMALPEREAMPGIGPRRAEIIVAGAEVYRELLESFGLAGFRYSPLGLRDGILAQMLAEQDARATAHREFEHERWEACWRRRGVTVWIRRNRSRCGRTRCSCFAS
jgi:exopolyphosphatase/guanosine-5'-triphosphate,3'-diphosphate pyrophosphatase